MFSAQISKNPHVQAATVALFALNIAQLNGENGEKAGQIIDNCCSRMGLPAVEGKLTRRQQAMDDAVKEAILVGADKMKAALVAARLLSKRN